MVSRLPSWSRPSSSVDRRCAPSISTTSAGGIQGPGGASLSSPRMRTTHTMRFTRIAMPSAMRSPKAYLELGQQLSAARHTIRGNPAPPPKPSAQQAKKKDDLSDYRWGAPKSFSAAEPGAGVAGGGAEPVRGGSTTAGSSISITISSTSKDTGLLLILDTDAFTESWET